MKMQRLLTALTVLNLGLLMFALAQIQGAGAAQDVAPVLRGRALEIVDGQGRVRASITLHPAGTANGQTYPETVMLRLSDPNGRPNVKLGASERGAGLGLGGESDPTYVTLKAEGTSTSLRLTNKDGRQQLIKP
jgi:hypothetical protein